MSYLITIPFNERPRAKAKRFNKRNKTDESILDAGRPKQINEDRAISFHRKIEKPSVFGTLESKKAGLGFFNHRVASSSALLYTCQDHVPKMIADHKSPFPARFTEPPTNVVELEDVVSGGGMSRDEMIWEVHPFRVQHRSSGRRI